ncbi:MAG: type II CAAX endopeptidase family protein [Betaproteobacteria bacterium]
MQRIRHAQEIAWVLAAICVGWLASRFWLYPTLGVPENAPMILRPILGFVVAWWLLRRGTEHWSDFGLRQPRRWISAMAIGVALYAIVWFNAHYILPPLAATLGTRSAPFFLGYIRGNPIAFAGWIAIAWIVGAFIEELLFRGFLLNRIAGLFDSRAAGLAVGVISQAVLFGALHFYQGSYGSVSAGLFALIFGIVYIAGGRILWPLVIVHGIWNSVGIAAIYGL